MKKVLTGLLLALLIFSNCRRKSSNSITASDQNDTTEILPPGPPGSAQDSTNSQNPDTTAQTAPKFTYMPQKQDLEAGNIGIIHKEDNANILSVYINICGGNNIFGVTFDLDYDSTKLKLKSVKEGDFLKSDGGSTFFDSTNSIIAVTRVGQASGVSGSGTVCVIELEAKKSFDSSHLSFKNQRATNKDLIEMLPANNWFGGVLMYK